MSAESYLSRGVSPTKDDVKAAVKNQSKGVSRVLSANLSKTSQAILNTALQFMLTEQAQNPPLLILCTKKQATTTGLRALLRTLS